MFHCDLGIVGDNFLHTTGGNRKYSTHGKAHTQVAWHPGCSCEYPTFYLDQHIAAGMEVEKRSPRYAWLIESRFIAVEANTFVEAHLDRVADAYDLLFTHRADLISQRPDKCRWLPATGYWIKCPGVRPKSRLVSFPTSTKASTDGHRYRLSLRDRFGTDPRVDVSGRGINEFERKEQVLDEYMFSFAIENGSYDCYFTEKLTDCLATGTIPIYWGASKESLRDLFDTRGIIFLDDQFDLEQLTPQRYESLLPHAVRNAELVWRYEFAEDFIVRELTRS